MMKLFLPWRRALAVTLLLTFSQAFSVFANEELKVGDMAPEFKLEGTDGKIYSLADFKGKEAVVLAWFPMAYTRGCTIECKSLADNGHLLKKYQVSYFMASVDPIDKNRGFSEKYQADFPLLSDPEKTVAKAYGVLNFFGVAKRVTFYIDSDGKIIHIDNDVIPKSSAEDMAAHLGRLKVPERHLSSD